MMNAAKTVLEHRMSDTPRPSMFELLERLKRFGVPGVSASDQYRSEQVLAIMEQQHEQNSKLAAENVRLSSQKEELRRRLEAELQSRTITEEVYRRHERQIAELQREKESLTQQLETQRSQFENAYNNLLARDEMEMAARDSRIEALEQALAVEKERGSLLESERKQRFAAQEELRQERLDSIAKDTELRSLREILQAAAIYVCSGGCWPESAVLPEGEHSELCKRLWAAIPQAVETETKEKK